MTKAKTATGKKKTSARSATRKLPVRRVSQKTKPVKKTAKKRAVKTVKSPAKTPKKKKPQLELVYAPAWKEFYAINGAVLRSLVDMYGELDTMLEDEYLYHKNTGDHFSLWVREVLCDDACAADLSLATSKKRAQTVLKKHLKKYTI